MLALDVGLLREVLRASEECVHRYEEEGGVILENAGKYAFVKVKNKHENTQEAIALYETDLSELQEKVFLKLSEGWKMFASFHTHPSFSPTPSQLDLAKLFQGFKYNVIYAKNVDRFSFSEWIQDVSCPVYVPRATIRAHINNVS